MYNIDNVYSIFQVTKLFVCFIVSSEELFVLPLLEKEASVSRWSNWIFFNEFIFELRKDYTYDRIYKI